MLEATKIAINLIAKTDSTITPEMLSNAFDVLNGQKMAPQERTHEEDTNRLLNLTEAANFLSVSRPYLWVLIKKGKLHVICMGERCRRIRYGELLELLKNEIQPEKKRVLPHEWNKIKQQNNTNVN